MAISLPSPVTIAPTQPFAVCVNITTVNDTVYKGNQTFNVSINYTNPMLTIGTPSFIEVTIVDDEGLFITYKLHQSPLDVSNTVCNNCTLCYLSSYILMTSQH